MDVEIKHLDVLSVAKICFVLYAVLGIVIALIYVVVALTLSGLMEYNDVFEDSGLLRIAATGVGLLLVPLVALIYGCIGAIGGVVFALVYNLVSRAIGGVRLTLAGDGGLQMEAGQYKSVEVRL